MKVGRYDVMREIGRGAMGVVFAARAPEGADVAIKVLHGVEAERVARFERERRLLGLFTAREGFVPLLDGGAVAQGLFLVMPLLRGGTLRARLQQGPLSVAETVRIGSALAHALGLAHERGVVHRDLKPENVLFDDAGAPLVADLGLAKHFDRLAPGASQSVSLSRQSDILGTAGYMAPEQLLDAKAVGPPADVFSLGAILYECLAGAPAFTGATVFEIVGRISSGEFQPLGRARPDAPRWLVAAVERALAVDVAARFQDGHALHRALQGRAASARRWPLLAGGAAVLLLAAGSAVVVRARASSGGVGAVVSSAGSTEDERAAEALEAHAMKLYEQGDMKGALEECQRAIALAPRRATAWNRSAAAKAGLGEMQGAIADATRAIELDPRFATAWHNRGAARYVADPKGAIADLTRAIELNPRDRDGWFLRAALRHEAGDLEGAIADYTRALALDPQVERVWHGRADARLRMNDLTGALADYTEALARDPRNMGSLNDRGATLIQLGDNKGALADFARAIYTNPANGHAWSSLGTLFFQTKEYASAVAAFTRALAIDPDNGSAWGGRGACRLELKDYAGAVADCTRIIAIDPKVAFPRLARGQAYDALGDAENAVADLKRFIELVPSDRRVPVIRRDIARLEAGIEAKRGAR